MVVSEEMSGDIHSIYCTLVFTNSYLQYTVSQYHCQISFDIYTNKFLVSMFFFLHNAHLTVSQLSFCIAATAGLRRLFSWYKNKKKNFLCFQQLRKRRLIFRKIFRLVPLKKTQTNYIKNYNNCFSVPLVQFLFT